MNYTDATATNSSSELVYQIPCKPPTIDSLKSENVRLKCENARLSAAFKVECYNAMIWRVVALGTLILFGVTVCMIL